jgi:hypothetical protein
MKNLFLISALVSVLAVSTACGVEHERTVLGPTSIQALTATPMTTGVGLQVLPASMGQRSSMIGTWRSTSSMSTKALTGPVFSSCGDFQWSITSQTATEASGRVSAVCAGDVNIEGTIVAQIGGSTLPLTFNGTATQGAIACSFSLNAVGVQLSSDTFRIEYSGMTCLGPVQGNEILRLASSSPEGDSQPEPAPTPDPAPEPAPAPEPVPAPSPFHVGPGPLSAARAQQVVYATSNEFPHLTAVMGSEQAATAAADELLGRTIWHLQLAGFQAARQRNPSGAISSDKVSIFINGAWHVYDVFSLGTAGRATRVQWLEVPLPNPVANGGIPD